MPKGGANVAVRIDVAKLKGKFLKMQKGALIDAVETRLRTEIDRSVANVRKSLSKKWSKGRASKPGKPPRMRTGELSEHISGSVRRGKQGRGHAISAQFGLVTRSPRLQAYGNVMEYGAPGITTDGEAIEAIQASGNNWLTVFPKWVLREDGTPIFKPKSNPSAPLTKGRVKNQGYIRTWYKHFGPGSKKLWVFGQKTSGKPVLLWVLVKEVVVEARPYLAPEADKFIARLKRSVFRDGVKEVL